MTQYPQNNIPTPDVPAIIVPPGIANPTQVGSTYLPFNPVGFPPALQDHPHWLVANSKGKPVERPDVGSSKTNPEHWTNFETASRLALSESGLWPYMVLTNETRFTVFDIDFKPIRPGETKLAFRARIQRAMMALHRLHKAFPRRYESRSKSGMGFHIIVVGKFIGKGGKGKDDWSEVEIYTRDHGITLTGHISNGCSDLIEYPNRFIQGIRNSIKGSGRTTENGDAAERPNQPVTAETLAVIQRLKEKNRLIPKLLTGEWEGHCYPSQSEADFSLACSIVEETANHEQQVEVFKNSGLYRCDRKMLLAFVAARKRVAEQSAAKPDMSENTDADEADDLVSPGFPLNCLPGIAREMAEELARVTTSQNLPIAVACVLGILSAALGAGLELSTGGERRTRGNLFILVIAESGTGKTEAYMLAAVPFEAAEAAAIDDFEKHTKPGLLAELRVAKAQAKKLEKAVAESKDGACPALESFRKAEQEIADLEKRIDATPRLRASDVTKEELAVMMACQLGEAIASLSSEARGIIAIVNGRYGKQGGDEDFYCAAYSGDSSSVDRVKRDSLALRKPCLVILWMVQPDAARKAFAQECFTESGLLPRCLMIDPKAEPKERTEQPAPIPDVIKEGWAKLITSLTKAYRLKSGIPQTIAVLPPVFEILNAYENENIRRRRHDGDLRDLAPYVARWTENAWRIALVLHAAEHGDKAHITALNADTANNAVTIMRWFSERQLEILASGRHEKLQKRLSALLAVLAQSTGEMTFRKLRRSHSFTESEIRHLNVTFPNAFSIEERKPEIGRPSPVVTIKPHSKI